MSHASTAPRVRDAGVVYPSLNLVSDVEIIGYFVALRCTVATFGEMSTRYMVHLLFLAALHEDILER